MANTILCHEHNLPLDEIIFSEVMFSKSEEISGENPEHIEFIRSRAIPVFESWGYKCTILRAETDYLDCFNRRIKNPRKNMEHKDLRFGFPCTGRCGIKRDCKIKPMTDYIRKMDEPVVQYLGLAIDEPKRLLAIKDDPFKESVLERFGYTENMAKELCQKYELLSPIYENSNRGGCWFCPYAKIKEHLKFKERYPDIWERFVALEDEENVKDVAYKRWNVYRTSLRERDRMLESELMV